MLERMLTLDREATEDLLKSKGEERMRWRYFDHKDETNSKHVFNRRAGRLLDVAKSGYYNTELCLEDFENVSCML